MCRTVVVSSVRIIMAMMCSPIIKRVTDYKAKHGDTCFRCVYECTLV